VTSAQSPDEPRRPHSTHDFTTSTEESLNEVWADVKSPGGGRTYSVGTIEILSNVVAPKFSFVDVELPPAPAPVINRETVSQVVILQAVNDDQTIEWQRYFYGRNGSFEGGTEGSNARAISVWTAFDCHGAPDWAATRIAICGETFDRQLPLSQAGLLTAWAPDRPNGFIAVYNGLGDLLWTYHFFGTSTVAKSAITDLCIRVEQRGGTTHDVVTYCGISTHGVPGLSTPLDPLLPFGALTAPPSCTSGVHGASNNGTQDGQWDGIVGRVSRPQGGTGPGVAEFHSIVGGTAQDALFGIAEITPTRFAVVGSTSDSVATTASFPLSDACLNSQAGYCVGVMMLFEVVVGSNQFATALNLLSSKSIGGVSSEVATVARDVAVIPDSSVSPALLPLLHIVGSTTDAGMFSTAAGFQSVHGGGVDGFYLAALEVSGDLLIANGSWVGGAGDQVLTGVAAWAEFPDHLAFVGYDLDVGGSDLLVGSVFRDTTTVHSPPQNPPPPSLQLVLARGGTIGGPGPEFPCMMGSKQAMTSGISFKDRNLGLPAGGGIAMGPTGRVHVVGGTNELGYPFTDPGLFLGRDYSGELDGIRTVFDMLPLGVSRTDGTGTDKGNNTTPLPTLGDGGTTPVACRTPYGVRPGSPWPQAKRMLLDYLGPAPNQGVQPHIIVDRPHLDSGVIASAIDVGFPAGPIVFDQMEIWVTPGSATTYWLPWTPGYEGSLRWSLGTLLPSMTFTLQVYILVNTPLSCGGGPALQSIASPALTIDY
jgi:hypothetical protein